MQAARHPLPGARWHFQHGPIDLVIGAEGDVRAVADCHEQAWLRFGSVLPELVAELPALRQPVDPYAPFEPPLHGPVARRMWQACHPHRRTFVTPMAAVAGAVSDEMVRCYARPGITRAWINNGGDIALHLSPGASVNVGLVTDPARADAGPHLATDGRFVVPHELPVRGVATSGWRGRSHSLGIADSVTVLAHTAAEADAAATLIANAVDVDDPRIVRRPACELKDDSDLGLLLVTVAVPVLAAATVHRALAAGRLAAQQMCRQRLAHSAVLVCQGQVVAVDAEGVRWAELAPLPHEHDSAEARKLVQ